eukprot:1755364-Rhodomonas_salina.1
MWIRALTEEDGVGAEQEVVGEVKVQVVRVFPPKPGPDSFISAFIGSRPLPHATSLSLCRCLVFSLPLCVLIPTCPPQHTHTHTRSEACAG